MLDIPRCDENARLPVLTIIVNELKSMPRAVLVESIFPSGGGSVLYRIAKRIPLCTPTPSSSGTTSTDAPASRDSVPGKSANTSADEPKAPADEEILRELASGREEAIGPLYARYAPLLLGMASQAVGRATAEEIVQDVRAGSGNSE